MVISSEKRELFQEEGFHEKKHMVKPCVTQKNIHAIQRKLYEWRELALKF